MIKQEDQAKIFEADFANIVRKVKAGKPLTKAERDIVAAATATSTTETLWSVNQLSEQTGLDRRTIKHRLEAAAVAPARADGKNKLYRGRDAFPALFAAERKTDNEALFASEARKAAADADIAEMKRDEMARHLIPADQVLAAWSFVVVELRQKILYAAGLTHQQKADILTDLQQIPLDEYFAKLGQTADPDDAPSPGAAAGAERPPVG